MRKIKRIIKKKYGRKGLRFSNDVACNMFTPYNVVKPIYSFVYGIKKTNTIRNEKIKNAIEAAEKELGNEGRVLVRVSGTEPLVRVMLEGKDEEKINVLAQEIAQVVRERLL